MSGDCRFVQACRGLVKNSKQARPDWQSHISRGRTGICQHGAFSGIAVIVASFVPAECPKGGGMWGIFGKPLKRAIRNTLGLHVVLYFVPYRGSRRQICKSQFLHYFKISRIVVESVAKAKAAAAIATPLSPMRSPEKKAVVNTRRAAPVKLRFEKFLQGLPQAENRFSDAARANTDTVHLAPVGGRRASPYNVWIHWLQNEEPDQFAKRGKADFQPQISLKTAQRTMKTFKLGYQACLRADFAATWGRKSCKHRKVWPRCSKISSATPP